MLFICDCYPLHIFAGSTYPECKNAYQHVANTFVLKLCCSIMTILSEKLGNSSRFFTSKLKLRMRIKLRRGTKHLIIYI